MKSKAKKNKKKLRNEIHEMKNDSSYCFRYECKIYAMFVHIVFFLGVYPKFKLENISDYLL